MHATNGELNFLSAEVDAVVVTFSPCWSMPLLVSFGQNGGQGWFNFGWLLAGATNPEDGRVGAPSFGQDSYQWQSRIRRTRCHVSSAFFL